MCSEDLQKEFLLLRLSVASDPVKKHVAEKFYLQFERNFYLKIIIIIIPTKLDRKFLRNFV